MATVFCSFLGSNGSLLLSSHGHVGNLSRCAYCLLLLTCPRSLERPDIVYAAIVALKLRFIDDGSLLVALELLWTCWLPCQK